MELTQTATETAPFMDFEDVEFDAPTEEANTKIEYVVGLAEAPAYDFCDPENFGCDAALTACQAVCDAIDPEDFETPEDYENAVLFCQEECTAYHGDCLASIEQCSLNLPFIWVGLAVNPPPP